MSKTLGVILIVLGLFGLAWGGFTYTTREKVVDIGPIHAKRLTTFRCLPSWARWRSLAVLYFSWQAGRHRFGGICFWSPLLTHGNRIEGPTPPNYRLSRCHRATSSFEWRAECAGDRHGATFTSSTIAKDTRPSGNRPRNILKRGVEHHD